MEKKGSLLIIDDNRELLSALDICLSPYFDTIDLLYNPEQLSYLLQKKKFDLILLDMNFSPGQTSGNEGIFWMNSIREANPDTGIVLITAFGDVSLAVKSMREGAIDFILKSWDESKIVSTVLAARKIHYSQKKINSLKEKGRQLKSDIDDRYRMYYGESYAMKKVRQLVDKVAVTEANVLILGENGTGKELIARQIHRLSKRSDDIFVKIDLGAISENLFESELFGYRKGAFTDAREDRPGRIEVASGGTVFLDEIGNLSLEMQTKLLSVLQNREIIRLGDHNAIPVDIRIISATNKNLYSAVDEMTFREDLFYRLNTIIINLPPLRERREDIQYLSEMFLQELNEAYERNVRLSRDSKEFLQTHEWPGNIRELKNLIEKGVILADNGQIELLDLKTGTGKKFSGEVRSFNLYDNEKKIIETALISLNWNISKAAKELGINRSTLYEKITRYEISQN
ncbi:MAG: sigma-54-dependent Fis family transcriptional regulator [Bacteroidia bacterium]|nr:MAG: sigma-54-dependent Fis family transcriptional regulator [Bacteroidia bacterium]